MPPPAAGQSSRVGLKRRAIPEEVRKARVFTWVECRRLDPRQLETQSLPPRRRCLEA